MCCVWGKNDSIGWINKEIKNKTNKKTKTKKHDQPLSLEASGWNKIYRDYIPPLTHKFTPNLHYHHCAPSHCTFTHIHCLQKLSWPSFKERQNADRNILLKQTSSYNKTNLRKRKRKEKKSWFPNSVTVLYQIMLVTEDIPAPSRETWSRRGLSNETIQALPLTPT